MRYAAGRLLTTVLTILGAMLLLFALTVLVPGDPAAILLGPQASPEYAARFIAEMGLDQPIHIRFFRFFAHLLTGDLGTDVLNGRRVAATVGAVLPYTLILTAAAIGLAMLLGIPLGTYAASRPGSWIDGALAGLSVAFIAIPSFVIAILLLLVFSVWLDWLPVLGTGREGDLLDQAERLILPTFALSIGWIGFIARLVRTSMLEVLSEPYIRTARAYGLPARQLLYTYALKNAFIARSLPSSASASADCWAAPSWSRSCSPARASAASCSMPSTRATIPSCRARSSSSSSCSWSPTSSSTSCIPRSIPGCGAYDPPPARKRRRLPGRRHRRCHAVRRPVRALHLSPTTLTSSM